LANTDHAFSEHLTNQLTSQIEKKTPNEKVKTFLPPLKIIGEGRNLQIIERAALLLRDNRLETREKREDIYERKDRGGKLQEKR
jgi:hypothetical protein